MYEAHIDYHNEQFDIEMQRTSWFTSLLMNASGNYKKNIKPDKLYTSVAEQKKKADGSLNKRYVEQQREQLMKKFNIE